MSISSCQKSFLPDNSGTVLIGLSHRKDREASVLGVLFFDYSEYSGINMLIMFSELCIRFLKLQELAEFNWNKSTMTVG